MEKVYLYLFSLTKTKKTKLHIQSLKLKGKLDNQNLRSVAMSKVLIDTNIFVYGIDEDSKYFDQAKQILDHSEKQLVTISKNLIEFLTVVTKSSGYNLNSELALEIIEEIIQSVEVIYPTPESLAIFTGLGTSVFPFRFKIHDFEIISIGLAPGIHEVATFNTKDFKSVQEISLSDI